MIKKSIYYVETDTQYEYFITAYIIVIYLYKSYFLERTLS